MSAKPATHVVGIHHSGPIATAAIVRNGRVVAAAGEERFSRRKHDRSFPHRAIDFCLREAGIGIADVSVFALGWNAGENVGLKYRAGHSDWMRYPGEWLASVPNHLVSRTGDRICHTIQQFESVSGSVHRIEYVDHHACHARLAIATSGFDECAVLVADGWSEQKVTSAYVARDGHIEMIRSVEFPQSIGCFYAAMTEHLGYAPFSDEWKVMGMAAYGDASRAPDVQQLIALLPDGRYEIDLSYFDYYFFERSGFCGPKMTNFLGPPRGRDEPLQQRHFDLAAAAQTTFEHVMTHVLTWLQQETGLGRLALTGGVAMNCLYNGRISRLTPFEQVAISFAPDDSGNSLGAALEVSHRMGHDVRAPGLTSALGAEFDDGLIERALKTYKIHHRRLDDIVATTADLVAAGKVIGWFQGRAEFGQRALGQRSILASPAIADMKERVNAAVKYREAYRPFAPVVAIEDLGRVFDATEGTPIRYMEKALPVRPEWHDRIPAVVHADGTGRPQTVDAAEQSLFHALLQACAARTGVPCLLNTSFNLNGEPVVNSPEDALRTFVTCGLDALVLGSFLVEKEPAQR